MNFSPDETLKALGALAAALIAGFFTWIAGNRAGRAAFITATSQAADQVIARYETMVRTLMGEVENLKHEVAHCQTAHADCQRQMDDLRRLVSDGPTPRKPK